MSKYNYNEDNQFILAKGLFIFGIINVVAAIFGMAIDPNPAWLFVTGIGLLIMTYLFWNFINLSEEIAKDVSKQNKKRRVKKDGTNRTRITKT